MFSIVWDSSLRNKAAASLIRPADGTGAIYRALGVVRLPDGRELRANLERTRGAGENGKAADSVVFYRNGRRCPEAHYSAAREYALAQFRALYRAALAVDFDESAPGWPSIHGGTIGEAPATAEASKPETIAIEMNWQAAAGIIRAALENGTGEGRRMAAVELGNMAKAADSGNEARRALLALATIANETAHCLGQPGSMARDEMDSAIAAAFALLTGEAPAANPLRDVAALAEYRLASDGCQAAGAIVLRRLPGNDVTPFVVHFRNDDDSRRTGRPAYYFGDYCATLAEAWEAFAAKLRRFDPTGRLGTAEAL